MDGILNYLHLVPNTPLQEVYVRFFPEGFPAQNLANGLPDLYKRSDGNVFWKLDLSLMSDIQRAALRDWYHYNVRMQRVDYNIDIQTDWNDLVPYRDVIAETGVQSPYASYMTIEPRDLAIAYCEDCPALARYCVPQEYWQSLITNLVVTRLQRLQAEQQRALQEGRFRVLQQQQTPSPSPEPHRSLPPQIRPPVRSDQGFDPTNTGFW